MAEIPYVRFPYASRVCSVCGSQCVSYSTPDYNIKNVVFLCLECGTKYSKDEAENLEFWVLK
jgi:transposase